VIPTATENSGQNTSPYAAHSTNAAEVRHDLVAHLTSVAALAAQFASGLGAEQTAYYLGLWHDLGKFDPAFQQYLAACENPTSSHSRGPDHKAAGAMLAQKYGGLLALILQGHHGGLHSPPELKSWLADKNQQLQSLEELLSLAHRMIPELVPKQRELALPPHVANNLAAEFFMRMLFSALVDADYLDTEAHFQPEQTALRGATATLEELWERFKDNQANLSGHRDDSLGQARHAIYEACLRAAEQPPGLFRLTVPTGGGKTRSALAFALRHALQHGQKRVIVAVPFISITEQTAAVYQEIFESNVPELPVVLEHHSGFYAIDQDEDFHPEAVWRRLAAENWDAPLIVTTTVQLFESMFAHAPSRCRKLHRLAESVIILDEAQTLPPHLLKPCLHALTELSLHYGTTVVLSTATQPAFEAIPLFQDIVSTEIVPEPERFFADLKRVNYEWLLDPPLSWADVACLLEESPQALAVVNTKADALAVLEALNDPDALHLSTLLCGAHRRAVINEVKRRLAAGEKCRLVSTQIIEAGVDLDFPVVARAIGPLDGIIQAAGRCNREGRLKRGRMIVFRPQEGGMPAGAYRTAAGVTEALLGIPGVDLDDPAIPREYFRQLFASVETDREGIQALRATFDYPEVARRFAMVDENSLGVVVTSYGPPPLRNQVNQALRELRYGSPRGRHLLRELQPYIVNVPLHTAESYYRQGLITLVQPGLGEWFGPYDPVRGLAPQEGGLLIV